MADSQRDRPVMGRRRFLGAALAAAGGVAAARAGILPPWDDGVAGATVPAQGAGPVGRYGALSTVSDENALLLPEGFRSRLVAVGGEPVPGTDHPWHPFPDGAATVPTGDGGWIYVSNSEVPYPGHGGAGAIRFDQRGEIVDAYRILDGTTMNCSGGMTSWGTWLSGEEIEHGIVWECDPWGRREAVPRPALGSFWHECAASDPVRQVIYLSEDQPDGLLYRFRPVRWGDLSAGALEAAAVDAAGAVTWVAVRDPGAVAGPARASAPGAMPFPGGEGLAISGDALYLTTKLNDHVYRFDLARSTVTPIYEGGGVLKGVDNLTVHQPTGDLFMCEDLTDMQVVTIAPDGTVAPFAQVVGQPASEITGIAFDPAWNRLYFSSQRGPSDKRLGDLVEGLVDARPLGRTFEILGPFVAPPTPTTTPTTAKRRARKKKRKKATTSP